MTWWRGLPKQGKLWFGFIAAFFGTLVSVSAAWPIVEPYVPGHRAYVREKVDEGAAKIRANIEPTRIGVIDVQIGIKLSRQAQIEDRLLTLEIDLAKAVDLEDQVRRRFQIKKLQEETQALEADIKALKHERDH